MSVLIFFVVLFALILVHEWGHFIAAKKTGMRVDEFGIGFPPKLFSWVKGETEYSFNALPIGGFVRIYGENAADAAADSAAGTDVSRSFTSKPAWAQAVVLVAGVTMNILFAWLLFTIALTIGAPTAVEEAAAGPDAVLMVQSVLPGGPAAAAGIPHGAVITGLSVNGESVAALTPQTFRRVTEQNAGMPLTITYTTGTGTEVVVVTPQTGIAANDSERAVVGVQLALVETVREPLHTAIYQGGVQTVSMLQAITVGIATLIAGSVNGTADFSAVTGPVGIVGMVGDAAAFGVIPLLLFTAMISLNLAVINVLPFPALDGGRLVFVAIESVIRRPINPVWVARVNTLGFVLLMALMVAVTYKDIAVRL